MVARCARARGRSPRPPSRGGAGAAPRGPAAAALSSPHRLHRRCPRRPPSGRPHVTAAGGGLAPPRRRAGRGAASLQTLAPLARARRPAPSGVPRAPDAARAADSARARGQAAARPQPPTLRPCPPARPRAPHPLGRARTRWAARAARRRQRQPAAPSTASWWSSHLEAAAFSKRPGACARARADESAAAARACGSSSVLPALCLCVRRSCNSARGSVPHKSERGATLLLLAKPARDITTPRTPRPAAAVGSASRVRAPGCCRRRLLLVPSRWCSPLHFTLRRAALPAQHVRHP